MKNNIFAIMTVKNEADIVEETLDAASKWANKIYVLDNGSWDGTWEKVLKQAQENEKIVPWGVYGAAFRDSLRQLVFNDYKNVSSPGDWWCRLDSDEFYIDDPREFIASLPGVVDHIYSASFQYYLTPSDLDRLLNAGGGWSSLKYFKCNHSEIRFFKQKESTWWPQNREWPLDLLEPAKKRIRLKHYQYRNIDQIKNRIDLRSNKNSGELFPHEKISGPDWYSRRGFVVPDNDVFVQNRIVLEEDLDLDVGKFSYDGSKLYVPKKRNWIKARAIIVISRLANKFGVSWGG